MKRFLQVFRDGKKSQGSLNEPLADNEQGNLQTLQRMIEIVNEDRIMPDLRRFVLREIVGGVKGHDAYGEIKSIFDFAQSRICYRKDPFGVERVADLWSTIYGMNDDAEDPTYQPEGDCGIKSTFIATCCALLGYKPVFFVMKQFADQHSFNHVYAGAYIDGEILSLDATPEDKPIGWHVAGAYQTFRVEIF